MKLKQFVWFVMLTTAAWAQGTPVQATAGVQREARGILRELIAINTTDSAAGDNTAAARAVAKTLVAAGYPAGDVQVLVPPGRSSKGNLVARLRSASGGGPHR